MYLYDFGVVFTPLLLDPALSHQHCSDKEANLGDQETFLLLLE